MAKKSKRALPAAFIPETELDARACARRIGDILARLEAADAAHASAALRATQAHAKIVGPLNDGLAAETHALEAYATRQVPARTLFAEGKRSADWPEATIGFRDHPASVKIAKGHKEDDVVRTLLKARKIKFLRRKVELDRDALLKDRAAAAKIAGIEIVQGESFFVAPKGAVSRVALRLGKVKIEENEDV